MSVIYGVDQSAFPGSSSLAWLASNGPFRVTGFYLGPAPNHSDAGWMTQRAPLAVAGWGFLPVYVGLQAQNSSLGASRGTTDGQAAVSLMRQAKFPAGSVVYLDIETGGPLASNFEDYLNAWVAAVEASPTCMAGIYCSHNLLSWAQAKTPAVWTYHIPDSGGQTFDPAALPAGTLDPGAIATQYRQNVYLEGYGSPPKVVDLNVCLVADPSNVASVRHALGV
jgi:hypothetical protein